MPAIEVRLADGLGGLRGWGSSGGPLPSAAPAPPASSSPSGVTGDGDAGLTAAWGAAAPAMGIGLGVAYAATVAAAVSRVAVLAGAGGGGGDDAPALWLFFGTLAGQWEAGWEGWELVGMWVLGEHRKAAGGAAGGVSWRSPRAAAQEGAGGRWEMGACGCVGGRKVLFWDSSAAWRSREGIQPSMIPHPLLLGGADC